MLSKINIYVLYFKHIIFENYLIYCTYSCKYLGKVKQVYVTNKYQDIRIKQRHYKFIYGDII